MGELCALRSTMPDQMKVWLSEEVDSSDLIVNATNFIGSWTHIPWVGVLDRRITTTSKHGLYVVILFAEEGIQAALCVGQGVTYTNEQMLLSKAERLRTEHSIPTNFSNGPLPKGTLGTSKVAAEYESAIVCYKILSRETLPSDAELKTDLKHAVTYVSKLAGIQEVRQMYAQSNSSEKLPFTIRGVTFHFAPEDVVTAFKSTTLDQWERKPGVDPYYHLVVDNDSKPAKAVFRNMPDIPGGFEFTKNDATRVFKKLGFEVLNKREQVDQRVWAIAPGSGAKFWDEFYSLGIIGIGWDRLGNLSQYKNVDEIKSSLSRDAEKNPSNSALAVYEFVHTIQTGDLVFAKQGTKTLVGFGKVTSDYRFDSTRPIFKNIREVRWLGKGEWELPEDSLLPIKTLTDITKDWKLVESLKQLVGYREGHYPENYTLARFTEESGFPEATISGWCTQLLRKKQVILQGPPGTGKTFIAERLARHFVSDSKGFWEVVQFHPSYAYEDFMQGIRPEVVDEHLSFRLQPGRFLQFCQQAAQRKDVHCVLIVDEINRANLSRVFGELMYLLEYRDKEVPLASGGRPFRIPENVYLIGTMNTADRSIALVDHALRRRFSFIFLGPQYEVLQRRLASFGLQAEGLISVLRRLNLAINDRNYEVGISFFLSDGSKLKETIGIIWSGEIEPYLEEYFYDQADKVDVFRWEKVSQTILKDWA